MTDKKEPYLKLYSRIYANLYDLNDPRYAASRRAYMEGFQMAISILKLKFESGECRYVDEVIDHLEWYVDGTD